MNRGTESSLEWVIRSVYSATSIRHLNVIASLLSFIFVSYFYCKGVVRILAIGSFLRVILIRTKLVSKDYWGYNTCRSYKENWLHNEANLVTDAQRGERTKLVPDWFHLLGRLKKFTKRKKKIGNDLLAQIYGLLSVISLKAPLPRCMAPSLFGILKA